ncbi:MAG: hypothetical protein Q7R65_03235 [bacterium]|nr:hypothetical protein [bacterium]
MLYFLYGSDTEKARAKAHEMLASLQKKKPEAELFRLDADNWNETRLDELAGAQGLFERKFIVFVNRLFDSKEVKEVLLKKLLAIAESENVFIFLEETMDKASLLKITESAEKIQSFEKIKTKKQEPFNIFSLSDALGERNRKLLWVIYQKALKTEASPEELSGILFWQIKNLMLARESASASAVGLNPFVFGKSKRYSRNFSPDELTKLAIELITLYHDSHRGQVDFEAGLERFVLKV